MYNFIDSIKFDKLKNCKIDIEQYINNYLLDLYARIYSIGLKYNKITEIIKIQQEYFNENIILLNNDFISKRDDLERGILNKLPVNSNCEFTRKEDQFAVLDYLSYEYKYLLNTELICHSKENLLLTIYSVSSALSYISMSSTYLFKHTCEDSKEKDISFLNMIVDTIGVIFSEAELDIYRILGSEKKCCEYLINYMLNNNLNYSEGKDFINNIDRIFLIANGIVDSYVIKKSINNLYHSGTNIRLEKNLLNHHPLKWLGWI